MGETVYGRFPQTVLDLVSDSVRDIIDSSTELDTLQRTCKNAFQLYSKTKPVPSKECIRRAKELPREGLHPMFKSVLERNELSALAFSERLKSFRPKQTVLEAEGDNSKPKHKQQGPCVHLVDVMKRKREVHEKIIQVVQARRSKNDTVKEDEPEMACAQIIKKKDSSGSKRKATSFMDEENFISSVPTYQNQQHTEAGLSVRGDGGFGSNRLESAVLDLVADYSAGMAKKKSVYHWDKRSKKYVKLNNGERVTANGKVKTEGGKKVTTNKTGIYQKWKSRTHNKVSNPGNDYQGNATHNIDRRGGCMNFRGAKRSFLPNADFPSEIRDLEQVRKERQKKANNVSNFKNKRERNLVKAMASLANLVGRGRGK